MLNSLLKKIIRGGVGRSRFIMAGVGLSVAMLLILAAVQIQVNYNQLLYGETNQDSIANFLVINKKIDGNSADNTLSNAELNQLKQQAFVDEVGQLASSKFKVSAQSPSSQFPFYTDLFFESVPDAFIDVRSSDWKWSEGSQTIPLIVPNQFLDLYNFGFAPSQNLMQLTQDMVMAIPVIININSVKGSAQFTGRVVGFSDRISSVLVPQNFLAWANKQFGSGEQAQPSRVVIKTSDPGNPQLVDYLRQHNLVTDNDKTRFSKYRQVVATVVSASWVTGAIMLVFALLVFSLFIQLTISSAKQEIGLLIALGASPRQLHNFLLKQFLPLNILIVVVCLAVVGLLQWWLQQFLQKQQMHVHALISAYTCAAALVVLLVLWLVNARTISKYISRAVS